MQPTDRREGIGMTRKSAIYALAVAVLMGTMAVAALADDQGMNAYGPADSSVSAQPEQGMDQQNAGEIREPVETGAVPEGHDSSPDFRRDTGEEPTVEIGGRVYRPGIDLW
jgi:hypothetical protein